MPDGSRLAVPVKGEAVRFPFIPLSRAIDRAREIFQASSRGQHPILVLDAQKLWGYTEKASGGFQTVAALKYYGLVSYIGNKDRRQLKLTDDARRLFLDECPEVHLKIFKKLAIAPQAFANLWRHWKTDPPSDTVARSTLKVEFGYAEKAASELLTLYKTNLSFAKLTEGGDDSLAAGPEISAGEQLEMATDPPGVAIGVGDYVQWTSNGQDQFPSPQRVAWVSEDGTRARVFGSMTGIATSELAMADPSKPTQWSKPRSDLPPEKWTPGYADLRSACCGVM